jgi:PhnB protein
MKIPEHYLPIMPYLILEDTKGFVEFMKNVFGAREHLIVPDGSGGVMHGELKIHDAMVMFGNAGGEWKEKSAAMYLHVEDVDSTYDTAMKNGAKSLHPPDKKDYGYTAGFEDPYGNHWFIVEAGKE